MNLGGRNNPFGTKEQDKDESGRKKSSLQHKKQNKDESVRLISLTITWAFARFNICVDPLLGIGFEVFFLVCALSYQICFI